MVKHCLGLYGKNLFSLEILENQTVTFANLSNFVALLGGEIKEIKVYLEIWLIYYLIYIWHILLNGISKILQVKF